MIYISIKLIKQHKSYLYTPYNPPIMKLCIKCDNMYYIGINEKNGNQLSHYCRNCGYTDETVLDNSCLLNVQVKKGEQKYNHIINEYTKLDPTLPRVHNINCPSSSCLTNTEPDKHAREVLYIRYDEDNMKYLYMCSTCDTVWRTDDNSN